MSSDELYERAEAALEAFDHGYETRLRDAVRDLLARCRDLEAVLRLLRRQRDEAEVERDAALADAARLRELILEATMNQYQYIAGNGEARRTPTDDWCDRARAALAVTEGTKE